MPVLLVVAYVVDGELAGAGESALVPLALLCSCLFAIALGPVSSAAANVYLRDVTYLVEVGLLLWFWMTPIVYDWTKVVRNCIGTTGLDWLFKLYLANPMANVVLGVPAGALAGGADRTQGAAVPYDGNLTSAPGSSVLAGCRFCSGWRSASSPRAQGNFAQEL